MVKNPLANAGDRHGLNPWVGKIPGSRKWHPTPVFLPEKFMGKGASWAIVHGAIKRQTQLSTQHITHIQTKIINV